MLVPRVQGVWCGHTGEQFSLEVSQMVLVNIPISEAVINNLQHPAEKSWQEAARCPLAVEEPDQPGQEILLLPEPLHQSDKRSEGAVWRTKEVTQVGSEMEKKKTKASSSESSARSNSGHSKQGCHKGVETCPITCASNTSPLVTALDLKRQEETKEIQVADEEEPQRGILGLPQEPNWEQSVERKCSGRGVVGGLRSWPNPIGACCPIAEPKRDWGSWGGPAYHQWKSGRRVGCWWGREKPAKTGEDYNTDENEENLNDLMLRMRKEAPQIYLTRRKVESLPMKTVQRDYNEISVGNGMLKIVTKTMYQKKESRPKKVP